MTKKVIYASIGIIVVIAGALAFFFAVNGFTGIKIPTVSIPSGPIFNQGALKEAKPLILSIDNLTARPIDNSSAEVRIAFNVFNPNIGTVMLETISYNIFTNSKRVVSGDIGEKPEGFVDSQENIFPIVGNSTLNIKDKSVVLKNDADAIIWNDIAKNNTKYLINGTFSYKQTSSFQSTGADNDFSIKFP
jgi:hypothetical protein